jgi:hypothetical protein
MDTELRRALVAMAKGMQHFPVCAKKDSLQDIVGTNLYAPFVLDLAFLTTRTANPPTAMATMLLLLLLLLVLHMSMSVLGTYSI